MPSIGAPATKKTTTVTVAIKCRPLTERERLRSRDIVRLQDYKEVLVLDPDVTKDCLERIKNRAKEKKYSFDYAFGPDCTNLDVYRRSICSIIAGVVQGLNATIFAYGSTGSGKTYKMVGIKDDPGLMVLSLHTIFDFIKKDKSTDEFEVTCSYLEVYNEAGCHLELREDPEKGIVVAGLRCVKTIGKDGAVVQALRARRQDILNNMRDNNETGVNYQKGMANTELQFERAMRDQVIHNQREAQRNLWYVLMSLGFGEKKILEFAARQGLANEDSTITPYLVQSDWKQSPILDHRTSIPSCCFPSAGQTYSTSSCSFKHRQDFDSRYMSGHWDLAHTFCREERHSSYHLLSNNHSP